jgi:hypothetical protein
MFAEKEIVAFSKSQDCVEEASSAVARIAFEEDMLADEMIVLFKNDKLGNIIIRLSHALAVSAFHVGLCEDRIKKIETENASLRSTVAMLSDL